MSAEDNRAVIVQYFDVISGKDASVTIGDLLSEDVVWHVPQSNPDIKPNPRVGFDAVMDIFVSGVNIYQQGSMDVQLQRLVADEDCVMSQFTLLAKLANGKDYKNDYIMLFSVKDGKINGVWEYLDTLYQYQLGTFEGRA
jgi:uncharacterized protein